MSLAQPSRTIVVEPVRVPEAASPPAPPAEPAAAPREPAQTAAKS